MPFSKFEKDCIGKHMARGKARAGKSFSQGQEKVVLGSTFLSIIGLAKGEGKANNHSNHPDE
jgi:hypothetical protein